MLWEAEATAAQLVWDRGGTAVARGRMLGLATHPMPQPCLSSYVRRTVLSQAAGSSDAACDDTRWLCLLIYPCSAPDLCVPVLKKHCV